MDTATIDSPLLIDFSAQIKAQIEREVRKLKERLEARYYSGNLVKAEYVLLGYTLYLHRGKELYQSGETIGGLPVRIDRSESRSILVCSNEGNEGGYRGMMEKTVW